jgi:myo-inositol 2-dehydrogenase / D-chiro-inositol 1-dehydrogenase
MNSTNSSPRAASRRQFLVTSGKAMAATALTGALVQPRPGYAAENNTIKIALVGCGGRGTGAAANALSTAGPTQLWAMADVFPRRVADSLAVLKEKYPQQVVVSPERQFSGFDAFRRAIDVLDRGDVVLLATPAAFRPAHFEYAVGKGVHVFMEKSFAVDAPGIRRIQKAGALAEAKRLKVASGLMWRHDPAREEVIQRIHDGAIGEVILLRTYRMHGPVGLTPKAPEISELAHQLANYNSFAWLNGSFFVDWLIHNIDVCCWAKNDWPIAAQGHGARAARTLNDEMLDQYFVEYTFPDGTKLYAEGRHTTGCWDIFSDIAHGARGSALIMENLAAANPRIYSGHIQNREHEIWRYRGGASDPYQIEQDLFFEAIRTDRVYNETERSARACMVSILGRMAADSGQWITYDEAFASALELAPDLDSLKSLDDRAPVMPDEQGRYPIPVPGQTRAI